MKKSFVLVMALAICLLVAGCASLTVPVSATSHPVGSKVGQSSGTIWLGFFGGHVDTGIQAAAQNGGIKNVSTVDWTVKPGILGIWCDYEVTITGE